MTDSPTFFAPQLLIPSKITDISFYEKAFGAVLLRRFNNDDGSVHVAELSVNGAMFHLHEEKISAWKFSPHIAKGVTTLIGLFTENVDALVDKAVTAGAKLISSPVTYDYGYRQAEIKDPFGHIWQIEQKISTQ